MAHITVGLSAHRVESLAAAEEAMAEHAVVALEEPPTDGFDDMLSGRVAIAEHLEQLVPEFPEYSRRQCAMLRRLHESGVKILQIEPFLAELESIHDAFDGGARPESLEHEGARWRVYSSERRWTGTLLEYYAASAGDDFDRVVDAVQSFARADAARGRLRDAMRADGLATLSAEAERLYVEAGYVHAGLVGQLRRRAPAGVAVRPLWLLAPGFRELSGCLATLAPGDRLTLSFSRKRAPDKDTSRLLAARSLIQVAISVKEELLPTAERPFPHTLDDVGTCRLVEGLDYQACRALYRDVRGLPPTESRSIVERHAAAGR